MYGLGISDEVKNIDWGRTSRDYMNYRPGPPSSLYDKLFAHGIGVEGQSIVDLGTGTGVMANEFSRNGCLVTGLDISKEQVSMAKMISDWECLNTTFIVNECEILPFADQSIDVFTANQSWLYFKHDKIIPEIKRVLKPNGKLVTSHFSWLPVPGGIANHSERLILEHNPAWTGAGYSGKIPLVPNWSLNEFNLITMFYYDEDIPFTRETWKGRVRASRGIGATLSEKEVQYFDKQHDELLRSISSEQFTINHRIDAHIFTL
jgi:SAM-dependent methyltransferase